MFKNYSGSAGLVIVILAFQSLLAAIAVLHLGKNNRILEEISQNTENISDYTKMLTCSYYYNVREFHKQRESVTYLSLDSKDYESAIKLMEKWAFEDKKSLGTDCTDCTVLDSVHYELYRECAGDGSRLVKTVKVSRW
jgi:hypothetical protein